MQTRKFFGALNSSAQSVASAAAAAALKAIDQEPNKKKFQVAFTLLPGEVAFYRSTLSLSTVQLCRFHSSMCFFCTKEVLFLESR